MKCALPMKFFTMRKACVHFTLILIGSAVSINACAQETLTAPSEHFRLKAGDKKKVVEPTPSLPDSIEEEVTTLRDISASLPSFEFTRIEPDNENHLPPGFYASFAPPTPDTVRVFEGGTSQAEVIKIGGGKEIIQGDSMGVLTDLKVRAADYRSDALSITRKGKTNSMVIRSGFIPGQGFGTNRFRFAVKPGKFTLRPGAMITASVHMTKEADNIGNILCAITKIDYENNVFFVEASNEIPSGESINWVVVNYPETFSTR